MNTSGGIVTSNDSLNNNQLGSTRKERRSNNRYKNLLKIPSITLKIIITSILIFAIINLIFFIKSIIYKDEVPSLLGYKPMVVLSGSMEPNIKVGDLIISRSVDTKSLRLGDVISYRFEGNIIITHRIKEIIDDGGVLFFKTQGDANNAEDEKVITEEQIEGRFIFSIPKLGHLSVFSKTTLGQIVFIILPVFIIIMSDPLIALFARKKIKIKQKRKYIIQRRE